MEKSEPISFFFFFKSVSFPMFLIRHGIIQKIKLDFVIVYKIRIQVQAKSECEFDQL